MTGKTKKEERVEENLSGKPSAEADQEQVEGPTKEDSQINEPARDAAPDPSSDKRSNGAAAAKAGEKDTPRPESLVAKAERMLRELVTDQDNGAQSQSTDEAELEPEDLREAYRKAQKEIEALKKQCDLNLRNLARSYDQIARLERRAAEIRKYGAERLARDIIGTHDNFNRALESGKANQDMDLHRWLEGIEGVAREFSSTLTRHGITTIQPRVGDEFDPAWHEALYNVPLPDHEPGRVIHVEQKGFRLHDRLLRPARVGVSAGLFDDGEDDEREDLEQD